MGKNLNQRLLSLGAKPFYEAGFADDGTGLRILFHFNTFDTIYSIFSLVEHTADCKYCCGHYKFSFVFLQISCKKMVRKNRFYKFV